MSLASPKPEPPHQVARDREAFLRPTRGGKRFAGEPSGPPPGFIQTLRVGEKAVDKLVGPIPDGVFRGEGDVEFIARIQSHGC